MQEGEGEAREKRRGYNELDSALIHRCVPECGSVNQRTVGMAFVNHMTTQGSVIFSHITLQTYNMSISTASLWMDGVLHAS